MHNCNRNPIAPPVPPRRAKRKIKAAPTASSVTAFSAFTEVTSRDLAGSRRKRPPPPPLPPPPECRRNKFRSAETYRLQPQCDTAKHSNTVESVNKQHRSSSRRRRDDGRITDTATSVIEATFPRSRDTISARENVTATDANADPVPRSMAVCSKPPFPSRDVVTKRRTRDRYPPLFFTMRDFQDVMSATWNGDDSTNASAYMGTDDSRDLCEKESSIMHTTLDDDDEEVCFRVTTTSYPFERCLERWRGSFEDDEFAQKSDDCRFEDSANGDDRVNIGESSGYDIVDKNDNSSCRVSLTKVRFVIESPSPPASECDFNVETSVSCDNSRNCEFILDDEQISEQSIASSAILTEIQDEFTDEKNCDDHLRNNLFISNIVQREEFLEKASCDEKEESINGDEKIRNESLRSDLKTYDSNDNVNLNDFDDESNSFAENSASIEQIRQLSNEKNKEMNDVSDTKNNREHASTSRGTFANVPVKVRRNSFLETMLIDDSIDTSINCAIIPTHTVSTPSINNKRSNKVQELDVDITRENGSYELNNAIKVDAENQKVLKDPEEIKEKLTEKTSSAIKPTQSTNRSVGDVKNDVLNELLCNFSSLKLKIVKPENKRPTRKMGANEDIARSVAIDKRIYGEKVNASFELQMHMSSHDEAYDVSMSAEAISSDANNEIAIVEKIVKGEAFARTKIEDKSQNLKNDARDPAIGGRIVKDKNVETMRPDESFRDIKRDARDVVIAGKIVEDIFTKTRADEKPLDIKSMETRANTRIMETFESTKSADEIERGFRKSPNARICKTTLERESADRERQTNEHRKRIPVGAPATMNKIFDSRESETIADASRRDNLENGRKREDVAKKTHGRGDKKTDEEEVIAYDEADTDDRRTASRSTLALENSGDKCAIASETTSVTPCNNDNNRAVTPVAVSKDQSSRDIVTITPGKVRSFIKYYEIRGDVTTEGHSKINDREQVARRKSTRSRATAPSVAARNSQWLEVTTEREARTSEEKCSRLNVLDVLEMSPDKSRLTTFGSRMLEDPIASSADRKTTEAKSEHRERSVATRLHGDETCAQSVKAGAKKSVQFLGGFTVIHSESFDESAGNWGSKKKQAPRRPPSRDSDGCQDFVRGIARSEKLLDVGRGSSQRREVVAEVHAVIDHGKNTGINRLIPKPKTPQLVLYCTV